MTTSAPVCGSRHFPRALGSGPQHVLALAVSRKLHGVRFRVNLHTCFDVSAKPLPHAWHDLPPQRMTEDPQGRRRPPEPPACSRGPDGFAPHFACGVLKAEPQTAERRDGICAILANAARNVPRGEGPERSVLWHSCNGAA